MRAELAETAHQDTAAAARRVAENRNFTEAVHLSITRIASFIGTFGACKMALLRPFEQLT